jgi:hypothetical protein
VDDSQWDGVDRDNKKRKGDTCKMKKWKVIAQSITTYEIEVTAENKYEAMDKADEIDGGQWVEIPGDGDWNPISAEEVTK